LEVFLFLSQSIHQPLSWSQLCYSCLPWPPFHCSFAMNCLSRWLRLVWFACLGSQFYVVCNLVNFYENVGCLCAWLVFFFYSFAVLCTASRGMGSSFATHSLLKLSRALWYFPRYSLYITVLFDLVNENP
jgi:hypothetical protein